MRRGIGAADLNIAVDFSRGISLARVTDFQGNSERQFGAAAARQQPLQSGEFTGSVDTGASCNCNTLTLTPHCNGTHTECVAHLTREPLDVFRITPLDLIAALCVSVPVGVITAQSLSDAWPARTSPKPKALILRQNQPSADPPGHLAPDAAALLVERGIEHLVTQLPSIDPLQDGGKLLAHRIFFGLPEKSYSLAEAIRSQCTITELAHLPVDLTDGPYMLQLHLPALCGDAVPSRPVLYPYVAS